MMWPFRRFGPLGQRKLDTEDKPKQEGNRFLFFGSKKANCETTNCEESGSSEKAAPFDLQKIGSSLLNMENLGSAEVTQIIGTGGVAGFCSGYACKKIGKAVAIVFGGLFLGFQVAAQKGYLEVHWSKIEKDIAVACDIPYHDGHIEVDQQEMQNRAMKYVNALGKHGGFATGSFMTSFLLGFKMG